MIQEALKQAYPLDRKKKKKGNQNGQKKPNGGAQTKNGNISANTYKKETNCKTK